ncbi:MAG: vitamin K epoxide reductase family protein [Candidatus Nanopelagicales bacterium]
MPDFEGSDEPGYEGDEQTPSRPRHIGAYSEMLVSSVLGLIASLVLSAEAITLAANPAATFACDLSSKISCGAVASTWQANLFGFPNAFIGLMAEPVVITVAVAGLAGVAFPRWFMVSAQAVYTIGVVFAYWLFYEAYFVIGALCPWCLLITVTTTLVFMSMTRVNILDGNFGSGIQQKLARPLRLGVDVAISAVLIALMAGAVVLNYL